MPADHFRLPIEFDLTLDYRFAFGNWPEWVKPLWIRGRASRVEQTFGGNTDVIKDYQIIMNHEWAFIWSKCPWQ